MLSDLVLSNGKIATMDANESIEEAVAVKFGRILAVGSNKAIKPLIGPETKVIDLKKRTVIPGLIDSHCHISHEAHVRAMGVIDGTYENGVRSIADILAKIAETVKKTPQGGWINIDKEDATKLLEKRHPYRWELDKVSPDNPVMIYTLGGHFFV